MLCAAKLNATTVKKLKKNARHYATSCPSIFMERFSVFFFFLRLYLLFYFWVRNGYKTKLQSRRVFPFQSMFSFRRWPTNGHTSNTSVVRRNGRRHTSDVDGGTMELWSRNDVGIVCGAKLGRVKLQQRAFFEFRARGFRLCRKSGC